LKKSKLKLKRKNKIMAENIKALLKKQEERIKRHIDVLKEDFDDKLKLIAEHTAKLLKN